MEQARNYGTIAYIAIVVIGVVFSLVQAMLKGKKFNSEALFNPETSSNANTTDFAEFDNEPMMIVDAQGNLINPPPPAPPPPTPPKDNRRGKRPEAVKSTVAISQQPQTGQADYHLSNNYIDFIRTHADSAVIMHEILGKPKALR